MRVPGTDADDCVREVTTADSCQKLKMTHINSRISQLQTNSRRLSGLVC